MKLEGTPGGGAYFDRGEPLTFTGTGTQVMRTRDFAGRSVRPVAGLTGTPGVDEAEFDFEVAVEPLVAPPLVLDAGCRSPVRYPLLVPPVIAARRAIVRAASGTSARETLTPLRTVGRSSAVVSGQVRFLDDASSAEIHLEESFDLTRWEPVGVGRVVKFDATGETKEGRVGPDSADPITAPFIRLILVASARTSTRFGVEFTNVTVTLVTRPEDQASLLSV